MSLQVKCTCGKAYQVKDELAGRRVKCQACQAIMQIPALPQEVASDDLFADLPPFTEPTNSPAGHTIPRGLSSGSGYGNYNVRSTTEAGPTTPSWSERASSPGHPSRAEKGAPEAEASRLPVLIGAGLMLAAGLLVIILGVLYAVVGYVRTENVHREQYAALRNPQLPQQVRSDWVARGADGIPDLLRALEDEAIPNAGVVAIFGELGDEAATAVDPLIEMLHAPQREVRAAAAEALGKIGAPARHSVLVLKQTVDDTDPATQAAALTALLALEGPQKLLPILKRMLTTPGGSSRSVAVQVTGKLGSAGETLLTDLLSALDGQNAVKPLEVYRAAVQIAPGSPQLFPYLVRTIENPDENVEVKRAVVELLPGFGLRAIPLATAAIETGPLLQTAARVLGDIGDPAGIPGLLRALDRLDEWERSQIAAAVSNELSKSVTIVSERNSRGEVTSQRQYGQPQYTGNFTQRAQDPHDPLGRQISSAASSTEQGRDVVREALRKLGVDGPEQIAAAKDRINQEGL